MLQHRWLTPTGQNKASSHSLTITRDTLHVIGTERRAMSPKARGLAQHGGPPGWLEKIDSAGCDFMRDERSMPPALKDPHTTCPSSGADLLLNVHKTPLWAMSHKEGMAWYSSRPMPSLWSQTHLFNIEAIEAKDGTAGQAELIALNVSFKTPPLHLWIHHWNSKGL